MSLEKHKETHNGPDEIKSLQEDKQMLKEISKDIGESNGNGICYLLKNNKVYRGKVWQTIWLGWSLFLLGWIFGQTGPSFLDILSITGTDLENGSAFMTAGFIGYLFGALIGGYLFDRLNRQMLLFSSIFVCAIDMAIIPWCFIYETMITSQALSGFLQGAWDAMANAQLMFIWGEDNGPYMQAIQFAFAVGGVVSPLVTSPFLLQRSSGQNSSGSSDIYNSTSPILITENSSNTAIIDSAVIINGTSFENDSRLFIAFSITSGLCLSSAIPFLYYYMHSKKQKHIEKRGNSMEDRTRHISILLKVLILINIMAFLGVFGVIESMAVQYLSPFCVTYFNMSKSDSSIIMSLYWVAFGVGRFSGIFLVKYFHYVKLIISFSIFAIIDSVGLLISSWKLFNVGIWIFGPLTGLGISIAFPIVITWTELEMFPVTGFISALYLIGGSSIRMLNPLLLGYLMEEVSEMYFCYLLVGYSVLILLFCLLTKILSNVISKRSGATASYKNQDIYIPCAIENSSKQDTSNTAN